MRKTIQTVAVSSPVLLTVAITVFSWVSLRVESYAQEVSSPVQISTSKGSIVIRMVQEKDFPGLARIPLLDAIEIALLQAPGGSLLKAEVGTGKGLLVHHVEVVTKDKSIMEFIIDAGTGEILSQTIDKTDDDKHERLHADDDD